MSICLHPDSGAKITIPRRTTIKPAYCGLFIVGQLHGLQQYQLGAKPNITPCTGSVLQPRLGVIPNMATSAEIREVFRVFCEEIHRAEDKLEAAVVAKVNELESRIKMLENDVYRLSGKPAASSARPDEEDKPLRLYMYE